MAGAPAPDDRALSEAMIDYWAAFARTGTPQAEGRPSWPRFEPGQNAIMTFDKDGPRPGPDPRAAVLQKMIDRP